MVSQIQFLDLNSKLNGVAQALPASTLQTFSVVPDIWILQLTRFQIERCSLHSFKAPTTTATIQSATLCSTVATLLAAMRCLWSCRANLAHQRGCALGSQLLVYMHGHFGATLLT